MQLAACAPYPVVHSAIDRMLKATDRLPARLHKLFTAEFIDNKSKEQICVELGLSEDEYQQQHREMLHNLRAAAA
jgi:DNA-directed RNA polymerase specialized sigma subunit